ncbi:E3 ubiquitin- ligase LIN [Olea europaea subsp. europaea]|uniref:E3 ubiquitin- ligase LIN n=1 Tax=Olea europaea subsp. europaea TaxID=158383 RepID=A0A8S0TI41_OLEEU|nr:E3 ubiquitin- ligase LIN [Olea europaea subsp. europaea]
MASIPPSPLDFSNDAEKLEFESVRALVALINQHIDSLFEDTQTWKSLNSKCTSKLKIQTREFFEFSDYSLLSNLYGGIEGIEEALQTKCMEQKTSKLQNSEKLLQDPASLDENGMTLGFPNSYLICCSYFYLSVVEKLRKNEWKAAIHFLQALLVSPRLVHTEFTPGVCQNLFLFCIKLENVKPLGSRRINVVSFTDSDNNEVDDAMRWIARNYKPWLMYYQIMSCGEITSADDQSRYIMNGDTEPQISYEKRAGMWTHTNLVKVHHLINNVEKETMYQSHKKLAAYADQSFCTGTAASSNTKCLKDILTESQSDTHSCTSSSMDECSPEDYAEDSEISLKNNSAEEDVPAEIFYQNLQGPSNSKLENIVANLRASRDQMHREANEVKRIKCFSQRFTNSLCDVDNYVEDEEKLHLHNYISSMTLKKCSSTAKKKSSFQPTLPDVCLQPEGSFHINQIGLFQKMISKLCFTKQLENCEGEYTVEMKTIYKLLNNKSGLKYSILKDVILDQLLMDISTSKEEQVVRTSVSILSTIVTENKSVVEDVKRKGLQLSDLATALKRNVHEAVILIYLLNPSPADIKTLELLPCLVEVVCSSQSYKVGVRSLLLTPPAASLMLIEVLVTEFDYETNNMHVAAISSPRVLSGLLHVPRQNNLEEFVSLASIFVKCMRFDGKCRKYILESSPVATFVSLLWSNQKRATNIALEFFHELLRMPRSSAINLLKQIQNEGSIDSMCALLLLIQNSDPDYKLLAANLLLQLEMLEDASAKCIHREQAVDALLEPLTCEENTVTQSLSAFILSNLGGTFSWTGESYTAAWLVKKSGLTSLDHKNMIRNCDFLDQSLQDSRIDAWCSKIAQRILNFGTSVFHALEKGLKSKSKRVSRDCLTAIAWLGSEVARCPKELRNAACEILINTIEQYVHPGFDLEERLLACLCIYNYTSGSGMKKIINLSEGVRESLRRLSNVNWMAEELLKVADYFQPNKWRISCVHRHILEAGHKCSGAVTALIYYTGQLYSGYADGSIKVWSIKGQKATLIEDIKEHKKAVTCFSLYEPGNCLLSGSVDKTIKIWQMVQRKLECIDVIPTKESIRSIDSWGELIFATTQSHKMKVFDASRKVNDVFKSKRVKCTRVAQGKLYIGCMDSSIQELVITNSRQLEIKAPSKSWMQNKPINSVAIYKDCLYSASLVLQGSKIKDWRKNNSPQISVVPEKGASILAMEVVEDFIYLNCSTSMSSLQVTNALYLL